MNKKILRTVETLLEEALVPEEEQPYGVPNNWIWVRLVPYAAQCLDRFRKPINAKERAKRHGNIPYYGATGQVGWIDDYLTDERLVLVGEDGAPFLDPYKKKAYLIEGKAWVNNHAHILKSNFGDIGNYYILNYLNVFNYTGYVGGTTRLKLTQKQLAAIPIPLPPLNEQKRIADKVERLLDKINQAKQLINEARETFELRRASILDKAFRGELTESWRGGATQYPSGFVLFQQIKKEREGKVQKKDTRKKILPITKDNAPYEIPDVWMWGRLGSLAIKIVDGAHHTPTYTMDGVPFLSVKNIRNNKVNFGDTKYISEEEHLLLTKRCKPEIGDVLITKSGTIGRTAVIDTTEEFSLFVSVALIKIGGLSLNPRFIELSLEHLISKEVGKKFIKGTAVKNLHLDELVNLPIPLASLEEQNLIVKQLEILLQKEADTKTILEETNEKLEEIKKAALTKAFAGELGTNNTEDENAIEFVKKILQSI